MHQGSNNITFANGSHALVKIAQQGSTAMDHKPSQGQLKTLRDPFMPAQDFMKRFDPKKTLSNQQLINAALHFSQTENHFWILSGRGH